MEPVALDTACPSGFFLSEGVCISCPDGTFTPYPGQAPACLPCSQGYGTSGNQSSVCVPCIGDTANGFGCDNTTLPDGIDIYTLSALVTMACLAIIVIALVSYKKLRTPSKQDDSPSPDGGASETGDSLLTEETLAGMTFRDGLPATSLQSSFTQPFTLDEDDEEEEEEDRKEKVLPAKEKTGNKLKTLPLAPRRPLGSRFYDTDAQLSDQEDDELACTPGGEEDEEGER